MKGGPWFVGGHFLTIRAWKPTFRPSTASISSVAVWAKLPELPIEYYDKEVLREIREAIGPVLRVDSNTVMGARGRFVRICVQVDLEKPLINTMLIGDDVQLVTYEGISTMCFSCGRMGHKKTNYQYTVQAPMETPNQRAGEEGMEQL